MLRASPSAVSTSSSFEGGSGVCSVRQGVPSFAVGESFGQNVTA